MLEWIAEVTHARRARRGAPLQALWGGYGELFRVALEGGLAPTAVVKWVHPPAADASASDARKRRSYEVEAAFYQDLAPRCDATCRVARLYGARRLDAGGWLFVLEDLDVAGFAVRHAEAAPRALDACLAWLAAFHARFLGAAPARLWPTGSYWHLATRTEECAAIADPALREVAGLVDARLAAARFQTVLHGDPKDANFCFPRGAGAVAAVDFQYAGRGCAMRDVAYLLYGRTDEPADGIAHAHLDTYFGHLRACLARTGASVDAAALEAEGRALYPLARLDFCRFLAGWRPAHWRHDHRGQQFVRAQLARLARAP